MKISAHVPVKTPMTERGTKHSAQIRIDLFPQMRAGWRGSWGKMGGQAMKAGEIALAGPHSCYWGGPQRGAHALAGLRVPGGLGKCLWLRDVCVPVLGATTVGATSIFVY